MHWAVVGELLQKMEAGEFLHRVHTLTPDGKEFEEWVFLRVINDMPEELGRDGDLRQCILQAYEVSGRL